MTGKSSASPATHTVAAGRDRARRTMHGASAALAVAAVAATGAISALAARESTAEQQSSALIRAQRSAAAAGAYREGLVAYAQAHPVIVTVPRTTRTVVDPTILIQASGPGVADLSNSVGGGGQTWAAAPPPSGGGAPQAPITAAAAPAVTAVAPPPPPPPATAPVPPVTTGGS